MKKWSTLIFIVKKIAGNSPDFYEDDTANFLTETDETIFSPSAGSIRRIMDFASSYEVLDSKSTGDIEMIIN